MAEPTVKVTKKKDRTMVMVTGPMTIMQALAIKEGLLKAFAEGKEVELSLAEVTEVDITGLQLLCSAHRTSLNAGVRFSLCGNRPQALTASAKLAGMHRQKGCTQDVTCTCVWKAEA